MKKKSPKSLSLHRETVRNLSEPVLHEAQGGVLVAAGETNPANSICHLPV